MNTSWIYDADGIDFNNDISKYVYKNRTVEDFLYEEKKLGVASNKGFGKTFLLKVKRQAFQNKNGIICLPKNMMVDVINSPKFDRSLSKYFENYENWVMLWKISITLSIYNNLRLDNLFNINIKSKLSDEIEELIKLNYIYTSEYFNYILTNNREFVNKLFNKTQDFFNILLSINLPICLFIDKIDQALSNQSHQIYGQTKMSTGPKNASFWQYAQLALAEVSYEILSKNPHIKVFYSIRSEALVDAGSISSLYENMTQYISFLRYSRKELEGMYNNYILSENDENLYYPELKRSNPSKSFIGIDTIEVKYVTNKTEPVFNYILRHTFMRPRDIMIICYNLYISDLSQYNGEELVSNIKIIVNRESQIILENYTSELERFLFNIDRDLLNYLCQFLNSNVLDKRNITYACNKLNEYNYFKNNIENYNLCIDDCTECENIHPFCQLYNLGILGILWKNRMGEFSIRFNNTNESLIQKANHLLPDSDLYFLHPCFASKAEHIRKNSKKAFSFMNNVLVADRERLSSESINTIHKEIVYNYKTMINERIFISSTCHDLQDQRQKIDILLSELGFEVIRSDSDSFNSKLNGVNSYDHCIDEMLKCKRMIFIIGERYGGIYKGDKYKNFAKEIAEIDSALSHPSISLMEFYVALKNNIPIQVFVDSNVYNERLSYKNNLPKYNPVFAKDNRVFHIINFISNQKINNWFRIYNDLEHLGELIKIVYQKW